MRALFAVAFQSRLRYSACGGMERCLWNLRTELSKKHEIHIVCRDAESRIENVHILGPASKEGVTDRACLLSRYIENVALMESEYDHVIAFNFPELLPALKRPVTCCFFNHSDNWLPRGSGELNHRFVFPAKWLRQAFIDDAEIAPERCFALAMGVDLSLFKPTRLTRHPNTRLRLVFSSVWHPSKGLPEFLESCLILSKRSLTFDVTLLGSTRLWDFGDQQESVYSGLERANIERLVRIYRAKLPQLTVTGEVSHESVASVLRVADLLVAPSRRREGLPLAVIESMASGTPALATNMGGMPELIDHELTGYLIEAADPKLIANQVESILMKGGIPSEMRQAAQNRVRPLTWEQVGRSFENMMNLQLSN